MDTRDFGSALKATLVGISEGFVRLFFNSAAVVPTDITNRLRSIRWLTAHRLRMESLRFER